MDVIGDGTHDGVRWWLQRFDGVVGFAVTMSGLDGSTYVAAMGELPDADLGIVEAWLVRTLAKSRSGREGRVVRAAAKSAAATSPSVVGDLTQPVRPVS